MPGIQRRSREASGFAACCQGLSQRKQVKLPREAGGYVAPKDQPMTVRRDCRVAIADDWRLRMGQLPFLSSLERNHKQGIRLFFAQGIRDDHTGTIGTPGQVSRSAEHLVYRGLDQCTLRPTQWRDQPQFILAALRFTTQEGDPAAVRRPGG